MKKTALMTLLACIPVGVAQARPPAKVREIVKNQVQKVDDRKDLANDKFDLAAIKAIAASWDSAQKSANKVAEKEADVRLLAWLAQEQRESKREMTETRVEANRATGEKNGALVEAVRSGTADDRRDLRDDRRDVRDDRKDQVQAVGNAITAASLAQELRLMQPSFDAQTATPVQYARKAELLVQLTNFSAKQVVQDKKEVVEDRKERREDGRERREDTRNRTK